MARHKKYVIGNWKMNTNLADATVLSEGIKNSVEEFKSLEVVICPPCVWLYPLAEALKHAPRNFALGAQNMYWEDKGAFTGEISPVMLKQLVKYVIIGHSERRYHFKESDELINDKIISALSHGLKAILCVGEWKKGSASIKNIIGQVENALAHVKEDQMNDVIIAYEPVWAIGTGEAATGEYACEVIEKIREKLSSMFNEKIAEEAPILYGGSVNSDGVMEFIGQEGIDGVLVGGASLKLNEFLKICSKISMNS
jgi:triosephosphate isomerase